MNDIYLMQRGTVIELLIAHTRATTGGRIRLRKTDAPEACLYDRTMRLYPASQLLILA